VQSMIPFFDALRALVRASESGDRRLELPVSNESCRLVVELNSKLDVGRMRHCCLLGVTVIGVEIVSPQNCDPTLPGVTCCGE
jgi:hypothetical protein